MGRVNTNESLIVHLRLENDSKKTIVEIESIADILQSGTTGQIVVVVKTMDDLEFAKQISIASRTDVPQSQL